MKIVVGRPDLRGRRSSFFGLPYFIRSFIEAIWKCAPFFVAFFLVIASLVGLGQGREAIAALLDPAAVNISWFLFPILLAYASVLTASFLFFLLDRWNTQPTMARGRFSAAYWTSTLLASLEERYPGFSTHLYAISGVSGGSIGAGYWLTLN